MISLDRLAGAIGNVPESDLPLLEDMRDAALRFIESQTGRYFGKVVLVEEWIDGTGFRNLWLGEPVVVTNPVTLAVSEFTHPGATAVVLVEDTDYELRVSTAPGAREGYLVRLGGSSVWDRCYEYLVTYSRGYALNAGPRDIEHVLVGLVRSRYTSGGSEVMKSETIGGYSYTRFDAGDLAALPGVDQATVDAWRRPVLA